MVSSCSPTSKASLSVEDREVDRQQRYWTEDTQLDQNILHDFTHNSQEDKVVLRLNQTLIILLQTLEGAHVLSD